jgi:hypothetical protein
MSETMRISREHFGHRSASASHTFLINSRHLEWMRRRTGRLTGARYDDLPSPSKCFLRCSVMQETASSYGDSTLREPAYSVRF